MPKKTNLRFAQWWNHLIPPVLFFAYLFSFLETPYFSLWESAIEILIFIPVIIGSAALGYVLNDLADLEQDKLAEKANSMLSLSVGMRMLAIGTLIGLTVLPWFWLPVNMFNMFFMGLQFVAYALYSFQPFRFKEKGVLGLITDSFYGHINPVLVTIFTFAPHYFEEYTFVWLILIVGWLMIKGIRNILLHQLDDRRKDRMTGTTTFTLAKGPLYVLHLINRVITPAEIVLAAANVFAVSYYCSEGGEDGYLFTLLFFVFLIGVYYKYALWKMFTMPYRQRKFKLLYFMNGWYERWMPIGLIVQLSVMSTEKWLIVGVVHLVLFPKVLLNLAADLQVIWKNLKDPH